jgi:hypothetical protein
MTSANSSNTDEDTRNLQRMLRVFASKQDYTIEKHDGMERSESSDRTGNETEQASGLTMKGT